jgi:SAM-dependent methyltransferase
VHQLSQAASKQGELWGHGFRDWVEFQEPASRAVWEVALDLAGVKEGVAVLDAGCGAGGALVLAGQRGAVLSGVDASVNMITVARDRLPHADLRIGDIQNLPFANGQSDAVISINAIQYSADPQLAVHEMGRVCRAGGRVVISVHGEARRSDMSAVTGAIFALFPQRPAGGPFALSRREILSSLIEGVARLRLAAIEESEPEFEYPSLEAAARGMMAAGGTRRAVEILGEERVRTAVRDSLARFEMSDGTVRQRNAFLHAVAIAESGPGVD